MMVGQRATPTYRAQSPWTAPPCACSTGTVAVAAEGPGSEALRADLARYYDQDAAARADRPLLAERVRRRDDFVRRLQDEGRTRVVEIGLGPGTDAVAMRDGRKVFAAAVEGMTRSASQALVST